MSSNNLLATPVARSLFIHPLVSTSTPDAKNSEESNVLKKERRKWKLPLKLEILREPYESPIIMNSEEIIQHSRFNVESEPIFGRFPTVESCRISDTYICSSMDVMGVCNYNDINRHDKNNKVNSMRNENVKEPEANTSSFQAHEEFKKEMNKNKKTKITTPKRKSPKVCKTTSNMLKSDKTKTPFKIIKNKKSPNNKTPCTYKIPHRSPKCKSPKSLQNPRKSPKNKNLKKKSPKNSKISPKKVQVCTISSTNYTSDNKHNKLPHISAKTLVKNSTNLNTQCNTLKTSKCPKTPILHTAVRAAIKQQREEFRKEKEMLLEKYYAKLAEEKKREEEREIQRLRQQTVFKAKPIRKYAPLPIVKKRPLTDPVSPTFNKRRRLDHNTHSHVTSNSNKI